MRYVYPNLLMTPRHERGNVVKGALFLSAIIILIGGFFVAGIMTEASARSSENGFQCYQGTYGLECGYRE